MRRVVDRIEWNQIDVDVDVVNPRGQLLSLFKRIINPSEHQVFQHHGSLLQAVNLSDGSSYLRKLKLSCQWNNGLPNFLIHTVQTECQVDGRKSLSTSDHGIRDANRRNQQAPWRTRELASICETLDGLEQILLIVKWLSHSHKHNVMQLSLFHVQKLPGLL